jgi:hypothetical protein
MWIEQKHNMPLSNIVVVNREDVVFVQAYDYIAIK